MSSFVERRIIAPLLEQLKQGQTPDKLALSAAFGFVICCCPLLGMTTGLCVAAGLIFRLNHPTLQLANYLFYPLQIALLIPFFRAGESLFGVAREPLALSEITGLFKTDWLLAGKTYGLMALRGAAAWLLIAPPSVYALYKALVPVMTRLRS